MVVEIELTWIEWFEADAKEKEEEEKEIEIEIRN